MLNSKQDHFAVVIAQENISDVALGSHPLPDTAHAQHHVLVSLNPTILFDYDQWTLKDFQTLGQIGRPVLINQDQMGVQQHGLMLEMPLPA